MLVGFVVGSIAGALAVHTWASSVLDLSVRAAAAVKAQQQSDIAPSAPTRYPTLDELVGMTNEDLASVDPVVMSIVVTKGIPEFANLDIEHYVKAVDVWAEMVRFDTERHWYRYEENPGKFNHSVADYKITWLASDINSLFNVDYDVLDFDFSDPSNLFLNGIVDRKRGTCVSMPMIYVALGWRLGYPIKLVQVPTHVFARWDDGKEKINIEATGYGASHPDSWYEERFFVSQELKRNGVELASLTPREMLAVLLLSRCSYWDVINDNEKRFEDSIRANLLYPKHPLVIGQLAESWQIRWHENKYLKRAVKHMMDAGSRLEAFARLERGKPIERLIAGPGGKAVRVIVDRTTGALTPVEEVHLD